MLWGYVMVSPAVILLIILLFIPMAESIYLSFFDTDPTLGQPVWIGLQGYIDLWNNGVLYNVTRNSMIWTVVVSLFQVLIGFLAALLLNRSFPLRALVRSVVILPWVLPGVVAALTWKLIYDAQYGIFNMLLHQIGIEQTPDWLGLPDVAMFSVILAAVWKGFPFAMLMFLAALQGVPQEQYEAARVDGANAWMQLWYITIPSISHVIKTVVLLVSIWTFNYFDMIYILTGGGPIDSTHIAPTYIYELSFRNYNFGNGSRVAVVSFIFVLLISSILIRQMNKAEKE